MMGQWALLLLEHHSSGIKLDSQLMCGTPLEPTTPLSEVMMIVGACTRHQCLGAVLTCVQLAVH